MPIGKDEATVQGMHGETKFRRFSCFVTYTTKTKAVAKARCPALGAALLSEIRVRTKMHCGPHVPRQAQECSCRPPLQPQLQSLSTTAVVLLHERSMLLLPPARSLGCDPWNDQAADVAERRDITSYCNYPSPKWLRGRFPWHAPRRWKLPQCWSYAV